MKCQWQSDNIYVSFAGLIFKPQWNAIRII
jgi:hypothetical protein